MEVNPQSAEILNAKVVYSLGQVQSNTINIDQVKQHLKNYLLANNPDMGRLIDFGFMHNSNTLSGIGTFKDYLKIVRDEICRTLQEDVQKLITTKKLFDNLNSTFDCLSAIGVDLNSLNVNTLILGYILRNMK